MFGSRHDGQYDANPAAVAEDLEAECNTIASPVLCLKPELMFLQGVNLIACFRRSLEPF
jgi:hypothetical protein